MHIEYVSDTLWARFRVAWLFPWVALWVSTMLLRVICIFRWVPFGPAGVPYVLVGLSA
jgi:hypothetical protein